MMNRISCETAKACQEIAAAQTELMQTLVLPAIIGVVFLAVVLNIRSLRKEAEA